MGSNPTATALVLAEDIEGASNPWVRGALEHSGRQHLTLPEVSRGHTSR